MDLKRCSKCGQEKERTEFHNHPTTKDRLQQACKACASALSKAWYRVNKERRNAKSNEFYASHRQEVIRNSSKRYASYPESVKKEISKRHYYKDIEETRRKQRVRYWLDPERAREKNRRARRNNLETDRAKSQRRKARQRQVENTLTAQDIKDVLEAACGICSYCLQKFDSLTIDHVIPISKGGGHVIDNVVAACKSCNSIKGDRPVTYMLNRGLCRQSPSLDPN